MVTFPTNYLLFYKQGLGINYPLFIVLVVAFGLLLAEMFSRHLEREQYVVIAVGVFFSSMVFVRSSEMLTFFNVLGSVLLLLIAVRTFEGKRFQSFFLVDYVKVLFLPFQFIAPFFEIFPSVVSVKTSGRSARRREIIRGSFMAIVALIVFAGLFASADARFEKIIDNLFTFKIDQDAINQTFLGVFVASFFIGAFSFMFRKMHAREAVPEQPNTRNLGAVETSILLTSINVLFFVFILLQASALFGSLFGGASHLLNQGLTYAQYAREGFFQLVAVAVLSFFIILFSEKHIMQNDGTHLRSFKIHSGILVLQVIAILISAFTRLSLYENAYGFTEIRLYSHAFMIWIGVVLVLLSFHIWKSGKSTHFYFYTFWTVAGLLFMMNVINPDVFIAKKNLARYQTTGLLDTSYLGTLSGDTLPYTIHLLDDPNEDIRKSFARGLYWRFYICNDCEDTREHSWKSDRLNRSKAEKLISSRQNMLEENKSYQGYSFYD